MNNPKYQFYIHSPAWRQKCKEAYAVYGKKCAKCSATKYLHIHHRTYKRLFREDIKDLIPLCRRCHKLLHKNKKSMRSRVEEATSYFLGEKFRIKRRRMKRVPEKLTNQKIREAKVCPLVDIVKFKEMYGIDYSLVKH